VGIVETCIKWLRGGADQVLGQTRSWGRPGPGAEEEEGIRDLAWRDVRKQQHGSTSEK